MQHQYNGLLTNLNQQPDNGTLRHKMNILLIEDDTEVSHSVAHLLNQQGYATQQCANGKDGLMMAINRAFHLILLDKLLPGLDGLELLRRLRQHRDTPVIMLSACGAEQDRIQGFTGGADDYLPKPFNMLELLLRIDALLRRSQHTIASHEHTHILEDSHLRLNFHDQSVMVAQQAVELTPIEFELLWTLVKHKQEILSKASLYQWVLHKPFNRYDRSLDMHISNLRAKLAAVTAGKPLIKTVRGKGYCYL